MHKQKSAKIIDALHLPVVLSFNIRKKKYEMLQKQSGNVLFLILIAVALFAALSYAVTSSTRSGESTISAQQRAIIISELTQYAARMGAEITKLTLINACQENEFDFEHNSFSHNFYERTDSVVRSDCALFKASGAGFPWIAPPQALQDATGKDHFELSVNITIDGVGKYLIETGHTAKELLYIANVTRDICIEINEQFGITNTGNEPPTDADETFNIPAANWQVYGSSRCDDGQGNICFPTGFGITIGDSDISEIFGHHTGCFHEGDDDEYFFYHVLLER